MASSRKANEPGMSASNWKDGDEMDAWCNVGTGDTVREMWWRKRRRKKDRLVTRGTEDGSMEGEMDRFYFSQPVGMDECVWCMMGASAIRQPITDFGLNGITNHGLPSCLHISENPMHLLPNRKPQAALFMCVFMCLLCYMFFFLWDQISKCVWVCVFVCLCL